MEKLYLIENIQEFENRQILFLQYIPKGINAWITSNRDFRWFIKVSPSKYLENIQEGQYVYYSGGDDLEIAQNDVRVALIKEQYESSVSQIKELRLADAERKCFAYTDIEELYSFHVNVGHGNHSLLVFKADGNVHVWMVDCSDYDYIAHRYHRKEIDCCLRHIQEQFNLDAIHIEVVMLTHPHYDHYSGINYYIGKRFIDKTTIVYLNSGYPVSRHNFTNLLVKLQQLKVRIIEPTTNNSCDNINILYPDANFDKKLSPNNVSSVYNICFENISYFVFPGDLETMGWDLMDKTKCVPRMNKTHYYAISHHGSANGHIRTGFCPYKRCVSSNLAFCLSRECVPVLMGRNRAYRGIYADCVINDFKGRIRYAEKDSRGHSASFLEIDLLSGMCNWY
ncbi:MAG: hypothetical protein NC226_07060 [Bacteroides cellulosilyticus]|nr:hypothetical protein [Bacteroides cellulosilyticus]